MSEEPEEKEQEEEEEDDCLDPVGISFWLGQGFMILGVVVGIWLAARAGFSEAARFSKHQDARLSRNTLRSVRSEFEENLNQVRSARDRLKRNQKAQVAIQTPILEAASGQSYMSLVDPMLLSEVERVLVHPLLAAAKLLADLDRIEQYPEQRDWILGILEKTLSYAETKILPLFDLQEKALQQLETQLKEAK